MEDNTFGATLKAKRTELGLSRNLLADSSGVDLETIRLIENLKIQHSRMKTIKALKQTLADVEAIKSAAPSTVPSSEENCYISMATEWLHNTEFSPEDKLLILDFLKIFPHLSTENKVAIIRFF